MRLFVNLVATMLLLRTQSFHLKRSTRGFAKALNVKKELGGYKSMFPVYKPKSENQKKYVKYLSDAKTRLIFIVGPAGTGKTLFACNQAIIDLKKGIIEKIIITRPVVPVEEDIGFLPGNINKKMDPWTRPIFDIFLEFYSQRDIDLMVQNGVIEISPLAYMRGRTFKKAFVIADEMQNSSPNQMMMLTTRLGSGSKMVVTGDLKQSDKGTYSGLLDFIKKFDIYEKLFEKKRETDALYNEKFKESNHYTGIKVVELETSDVERSPIVSRVLDIYDEEKNINELDALKKNETKIIISEQNGKTSQVEGDAALIPLKHKEIIDKYFFQVN
jgi:phosphate starvation-inducible PhoH-like protein